MKTLKVIAILLLSAIAFGQSTVINGGRQILGLWDASLATSTKPIQAAASNPATCQLWQYVVNTTTGHTYVCNPANTWSQVDGGGGGGGGGYNITSPLSTLSLANCIPGSAGCTIDVAVGVTTPALVSGGFTCPYAAPNYTCAPASLTANSTLAVSGLTAGVPNYTLIWTMPATGGGYTIAYPMGWTNFCQPVYDSGTIVTTVVKFHYNGTAGVEDSCISNANGLFFLGPERAVFTTSLSGQDICTAGNTSHTLECYGNNSTNRHIAVRCAGTSDQCAFSDITGTVAAGQLPASVIQRTANSTQITLPTTAVSAGACDASATTALASGLQNGNSIDPTFTTDPTGISGYGPGQLYLQYWATSNTANFKRCNPTTGSITPAAATLNLVFPL